MAGHSSTLASAGAAGTHRWEYAFVLPPTDPAADADAVLALDRDLTARDGRALVTVTGAVEI